MRTPTRCSLTIWTLHYPIATSTPLAQQFFDQGLRLAYAFNHGEALRALRKARTLDPDCGMCYWGEALVLGPNINAPMDASSFPAALDAVSKAQAASSKSNAKERALIGTVTARYTDRGNIDQAYADAMQKVAASYPEDDQIAVLYAESLMDLQPWDYWSAAGTQPKGRAAEIVSLLEKVLKRTSDHPGAIHYYIHLTEASSDPKRAVPHAQRLGALMPGAGHIVHMPFHTFFRVGMYKEAIDANRRAVIADEAYITRSAPVGIYPQGYYPHNVHSLMVSAQMVGDGRTVIESADKLSEVVSDAAAKNIADQSCAILCPRAVQRCQDHSQPAGAWRGFSVCASDVALRAQRGTGWGWRCDEGAGRGRCHRKARGDRRLLWPDGRWCSSQGNLAPGPARGERADRASEQSLAGAAKYFETAVAMEDALAYSEPPFWYYPTRQSLGAALLMTGQSDRGEEVLRASLARTPNNGWALFGLMKVYQQRGDAASARAAKQLLDKAWMGKRRPWIWRGYEGR